VKVTQVSVNQPLFTGQKYTVKATPHEIIVACGDCSVPGVWFYDGDLSPIYGGGFPIVNKNNTMLHLAVSYQPTIKNT
jgi:hypothetical protein